MTRTTASLCLVACIAFSCTQAPPVPPHWVLVSHLRVGQTPGPVTLGGDWAFVPDMGDGTVTEIERSTGRVVATITVGDPKVLRNQGCAPDSVHAYYSGSWGWRACDTPYAIAWDGAYLWALDNGNHQLVRVDPIKHVVDHRVDLPGVGWSIAMGEGKAFVSGYPEHALYVVDVQSQLITAVVKNLDLGPATLAYGAGAVWVNCVVGTDGVGYLDRIDPVAAHVVARYPIEWWSEDVASAQDTVYMRGSFGGDITRIDTGSGAAHWTQSGPGFIGRQGIDQLGIAANGVWVSGPTTVLFDAEKGQVIDRIQVPSTAVAADGGEVWLLEVDGSIGKFKWQ